MPSKIEYYICDVCMRSWDTYEQALLCESSDNENRGYVWYKHPVDGIEKPIVRLND